MLNKVPRWAIIAAIVVVVVIVVLVLVLGVFTSDDEKDKVTQTSVQLSWVHEAEFTGFYAAIDQEYYKEENLEVRLDVGGIDPETGYIDPPPKVLAGEADFGISNAETMLRARAEGEPVVAIAAIYQRSPRVFISLAEKGITRPQDLVGKRVVDRSDVAATYKALLDTAGVDPDEVVAITDPALFSLDALINDEVDVTPGFITSEVVDLNHRGYETNEIIVSEFGIEDFQNVIFTTDDMIRDNPDLVTRFLRATLRGYEYAAQNPDEAVALILKYDPELDAEVQKLSMAQTVPLIQVAGVPIGTIDVEFWDAWFQTLRDQGVLAEDADVEGAYTLTFLDEIYKND